MKIQVSCYCCGKTFKANIAKNDDTQICNSCLYEKKEPISVQEKLFCDILKQHTLSAGPIAQPKSEEYIPELHRQIL